MPAPLSKPDDPALLRIDGAIATITLNRPAAFNSVNLAIAQKLEQLAAYIEGDDAIKVVVIEGEGSARSARAARCRFFWPRTISPRSRPMNGASSPRSFRRRS